MSSPVTCSHHEPVMGTVVSYRIEPSELPGPALDAAIAASTAELHRLEAIFSTWQPSSPMSCLRRGEIDLAAAPDEVSVVLEICGSVKSLSGGWFDPWAMPGGLDPTGLVKGWAIERATSILVEHGLGAGLVNGGGDIASFGEGLSFRVGVRHPWRHESLACVLDLSGGAAIATSGTYERGAHLVEPPGHRRRGPGVVSASVTGPSLAIADGLATGLAVAGRSGAELAPALAGEGYESYLIFEDGSEELTGGFPVAGPVRSS